MNKTRAFNFIGALLMILLLVMQFTSFWQAGEEAGSVSIQGYVWFPDKHQDLTRELQGQLNDPSFSVGSIVLMPILELAVCSVGAVFCLVKSDRFLTMLFPAAAGIAGIWGYLKPAFRLGSSWTVHLALCILLFAAAVLFFVLWGSHKIKPAEAKQP